MGRPKLVLSPSQQSQRLRTNSPARGLALCGANSHSQAIPAESTSRPASRPQQTTEHRLYELGKPKSSRLSTTMFDEAIILPELEAEVNKAMMKPKPTQDQKLVRKYLIQDIYKIKRKPEELTLLLNSHSGLRTTFADAQPAAAQPRDSLLHKLKVAEKPLYRVEQSKSATSTRLDTRKEAEPTFNPLDRPNRLRLQTADATHQKKRQASAAKPEETLQRSRSVGLGKKLARLYENEPSRPVTSKWPRSHSSKEFTSKREHLEPSCDFGSHVLGVVKELRRFSNLLE